MDVTRNTLIGLLAVTFYPSLAWAQTGSAGQVTREVIRRPVYETRYEPRQQVSYEQVPETRWRTETTTRWEPVTRTKRVVVDEGKWERVWVPRLGDFDRVWVPKLAEREENQTTYEKRVIRNQVPYEVTRSVPVTTTRYEPVVQRRIVEEEIVKVHPNRGNSLASSSSSIPSSRLGEYRPTISSARSAFEQVNARVAEARSGSRLSHPTMAARRPNVPTAATAWQASGTLRR